MESEKPFLFKDKILASFMKTVIDIGVENLRQIEAANAWEEEPPLGKPPHWLFRGKERRQRRRKRVAAEKRKQHRHMKHNAPAAKRARKAVRKHRQLQRSAARRR